MYNVGDVVMVLPYDEIVDSSGRSQYNFPESLKIYCEQCGIVAEKWVDGEGVEGVNIKFDNLKQEAFYLGEVVILSVPKDTCKSKVALPF